MPAPADLAAFLDAARRAPGVVAYASSGVGSSAHLGAELLASMAGIELLHVPYRGGGPASQALVAGEVATGFTDAPTALPLMRGGAVRALAVAGEARSPAAPEVPTVAEAGGPALAGYSCAAEFALFAPAGLPEAVARRAAAAVAAALRAPEVRARLDEAAMEVVAAPPEAWPAYIAREHERWGGLIRARGIRAS